MKLNVVFIFGGYILTCLDFASLMYVSISSFLSHTSIHFIINWNLSKNLSEGLYWSKWVLRGDQRGNCSILAICLLIHQKEKGYMLTHQKNCSILAICSTVNSWSMLKAYMCGYVCCVIIFLIINSRDQYQLIANWFILYPNWISSICITSFCQNFPLFDLTPFHISWLWSWIPLICGQENEILVTVEIIDSPN